MRRAKVLVVDDSAVVRKLLSDALNRESGIDVVGGAPDPFIARDLILRHEPDVMTLDIEMPRMDGLSFLRRVMEHRPMPVIIVSSITQRGSAASVEALRLGAIDVIAKPEGPGSVGRIAADIARRIRMLDSEPAIRISRADHAVRPAAPVVRVMSPVKPRGGLIVIGASTGGTQAIETLLTRLPAEMPPILIVQHMPAGFTKAFADRLNGVCPMRVIESAGNETLEPGTVYVAPGDRHLVVERAGVRLRTGLRDDAPVHYQRPAVDVLFQSAARLQGVPIAAAILTGMGRDGAEGLLALRRAGAITLAEDEQSCVVFGMPKEAIAVGAACRVATLLDMPRELVAAYTTAANGSANALAVS
jgi:two-component system, chemotaxis family, protein-glutamate methylesterase/glutaminase